MQTLTDKLNPQQIEATLHTTGPLLILAGAGSGKTRVLTHRMANLIAKGIADPEQILCVTFTNKAAREMEHRIYKLLADLDLPVYSRLWINTFHSFCVRLLKEKITLLHYKPFFTIYDSNDQLAQIKKVMSALNINDKIFPAKSFQSRISSAKMAGLSPAELEKLHAKSPLDRKTLDLYSAYEAEMKKNNALDFDDLLLKTWELFRMYPDTLAEYQEKFQFIMVDEYQDTNHIQYLLMRSLAARHRNLCVVGDEDQSIYSWRGADIKNILDFEKDFKEAKVVKLEENYRSTANIVQAASHLIKNNTQRKDKTLFTSNQAGQLIEVQEERNEYEEAKFVARSIEKLTSSGESVWSDIAIFYRTNAQSRVLEEQLRTLSIPYKIIGGVRFYDRMEVKDILSYMKLSLNSADDISFKRIFNVPTRGLGKTTMEKIEELAATKKITLMQAADEAIQMKIFNSGTTAKLRRLIDLLIENQANAVQNSIQDFYHIVLDRTQYLQNLKAEDTPEAESRIQNLEELDNAIAQFAKERGEDSSLQSFLEEMALVSDQDNISDNLNTVTMMTLHISKGLEYPHVFIVGLEENLFPSNRNGMSGENEDDIEEERRLAYVGMTRARERLFLTYAQSRRVWGQEQSNQPSRFIKEIPQEFLKHNTAFIQRPKLYSSEVFSGGTKPNYYFRNQNDDTIDHQRFPNDLSSSFESEYTRGMKVRHPTFGVGSVYATEGIGDQLKVSILFSDSTIKKFVVKYARLEKL
jgi:DNA helicase II / ATP-dependent DNA helicase PcrA